MRVINQTKKNQTKVRRTRREGPATYFAREEQNDHLMHRIEILFHPEIRVPLHHIVQYDNFYMKK